MLLDALAVHAFADELNQAFAGARVQDLLQPDRLSTVLELYAGERCYLTLSADAGSEGVGLSRDRARRGSGAATPLTLALRTHLDGARLQSARATPYERVLTLTFQGASRLELVAELTGRQANLILVAEDETVLALARPVTAAMSRTRLVLPGRPYAPPPSPGKTLPRDVTESLVADWLAESPGEPAWRGVVAHMLGVAPLAARELVARASGDALTPAGATDPARLSQALSNLWREALSGRAEPCVAYDDAGEVTAYAAYALTHLGDWQPQASISAAISAYEAARSGVDPYRAARAEVAALIAVALNRAARREAALEREQADPAAIAALRQAGELILSFRHQIRPGDRQLVAGFDPNQPETVLLDPALGATENAERYFDRYRRKRKAAEALPARLAEAAAVRATLEQLALDLDLATDRAAIDAVHDELAALGYTPRPGRPRAAAPSAPLTWVSSDGLTVLVGRNSRQNERLTFERAARGDLWLHALDVPGAHVVIKAAGRAVPERTILEAAALAAWFSRARNELAAAVAVTDVRYVKRLKGGGPGMVSVQQAETVVVRPAGPGD
jgi:predicted ribosome quality control (RQC) complex YloA/Tae2 family protein